MRRIAIALAVVLAGCGGNQQHQMPPPDVNVATVVQKSVTQWDDYSGHIQAIDAAEIRPRVAGHLEAIHYEEGGLVGKGQLLFTIDSREYRTQAKNREAARERLTALIRQATIVPVRRRKTAVTKAARQRRLATKKRRGEIKAGRGRPSGEE